MQGIPASGKSTYSKQYVKDNENCVRVSRDDLRIMLGQTFNYSLEKLVKRIADFTVRSALDKGYDVIIDETNIIAKTIVHWTEIAKEFGTEVEVKTIDISLEEAIARNENRTPNVPKDVVEYFYYLLHPTEKSVTE